MKYQRQGRPFKFVGGAACLDFTNTKNWDSHEAKYERFRSFADLVWWNQAAGHFGDDLTEWLLSETEQQPAVAAVLFEQGVTLRRTLHHTFAAIAAGQPLEAIDLTLLNDILVGMLSHSRLAPTQAKFAWAWAGDDLALDRIFWPVAHSAATLLTSTQLERVKQCAGRSCGWLFVDTSRNGRRRWCEMEHCGNRAKARRYYRRHRTD